MCIALEEPGDLVAAAAGSFVTFEACVLRSKIHSESGDVRFPASDARGRRSRRLPGFLLEPLHDIRLIGNRNVRMIDQQ